MQALGAARQGSVLSEQTVLAFAPEPPTSTCSPFLPTCVSEGRGGKSGFAMNHKTQLQFSLGSRPDQSNLPATFEPTRPSPVVVEKLDAKSATIGMSNTRVEDFKAISPARLSLALKLAKRNARMNSAQGLPGGPKSPVSPRDNMYESEGGGRDGAVQFEASLKPEPAPHKTSLKPEPGPHTTLLKPEPAPHQGRKRSSQTSTRDVPVPSMVASLAQEVARLRTDMQKKLVELNQVKEHQSQWRSPRRHGPVLNERVYWQGPVDEDEERIQVRRVEQVARNARRIYDLSHQVKSLQRLFSLKGKEGVQPQMTRKLAAAQRAALRTLQGYSSHGRWANPIPPELNMLIQQLALLSGKLGDPNSELESTLNQLMASLDNKEKLDLSLQIQSDVSPKKKFVWSRDVITNSRKSSYPQRKRYSSVAQQEARFTTPTYNSSRRQEPLQPYTPLNSGRQPQASTPAGATLPDSTAHKVSHKKRDKGQRKNGAKASTKNGAAGPSHSAKKSKQQKSAKVKFIDLESSTLSDTVSSDALLGSPVDVGTAIAMQARQLQLLREEISQKLSTVRGASGRPNEALTVSVGGGGEGGEESIDGDDDGAKHPVTSLTPRMSSMMSRLEELEAEEEAIRQRWNTIAYEDPLTARPVVTLENKMKYGKEGAKQPTSVRKQVTTLPLLSSKRLSHIQQYREQYSRYLNTTGVSTQGGFDPWKLAESIADQLLEELLEGVAREVGQVCDGCVDELFGSEFIRPP